MDPVEFPPGYKTAEQVMREARAILCRIAADIEKMDEEQRQKVEIPQDRGGRQDPERRGEQLSGRITEGRRKCLAETQTDLMHLDEYERDFMRFDRDMEPIPQTPLVPGGRVVPQLLESYGRGPRSSRRQEAEAYYQHFPHFEPPAQPEVEPYWAQYHIPPEDDLSEFFGQGVSSVPPWELRTPQEIGREFDPYYTAESPSRHTTYLEELAPTWDEEPEVYRHHRAACIRQLPREYIEEFDPYHSPEQPTYSHSNFEELSSCPTNPCPQSAEEERIRVQVDKILQQTRSRIANALMKQDMGK